MLSTLLRTALLGVLLGAAMDARAEASTPKRFAVLEFAAAKSLSVEQLQSLSDQARAGALSVLPRDRFLVMTRESIATIIRDMGKDLTACSDGECEVDVLQNLQADYGVTGTVLFVDRTYIVTLKLFETRRSALIGTTRAKSKKFEKLLDEVEAGTARMIKSALGADIAPPVAEVAEKRGSTPSNQPTAIALSRAPPLSTASAAEGEGPRLRTLKAELDRARKAPLRVALSPDFYAYNLRRMDEWRPLFDMAAANNLTLDEYAGEEPLQAYDVFVWDVCKPEHARMIFPHLDALLGEGKVVILLATNNCSWEGVYAAARANEVLVPRGLHFTKDDELESYEVTPTASPFVKDAGPFLGFRTAYVELDGPGGLAFAKRGSNIVVAGTRGGSKDGLLVAAGYSGDFLLGVHNKASEQTDHRVLGFFRSLAENARATKEMRVKAKIAGLAGGE